MAIGLVRSIVSYVGQRSTQLTGPMLDRFIASQCQACIAHLRSASLTHADATQIVDVLQSDECLFTGEQIASISAVVDDKLSGAFRPMSSSKSKLQPMSQKHNDLRNYLTEYMWGVVYSHASMPAKLEQCATFFVQTLLLRNPDEPTMRDMIVIILVATDSEQQGEAALGHLHMLKRFIVNARNAFSQSEKGPDEYPADVNACMRMYRYYSD